MKLAGAAATRFFAKPEPDRAGLLIFGADGMRVALKRQEVIAALIGPEGEAEMRLTRIPAADLRKDPALVADALKAQGFFPGPRVAFVEDAADGLAPVLKAALADWKPGDAMLVVTAGSLTKASALKKAFEEHPNAYAAGIYDDPPSRDEIEAVLAKAGLTEIGREAMTDLLALARDLDPGDFRQTVEKIALYKFGDSAPLAPAEVAACAPATIEAEVDDVLHAVAETRVADVGPLMRRLEGQGVNPVTLSIAAMRHFRTLHMAASAPGGPSEGIARMRPPVFGPRRDRMLRQAQNWGMHRLENAIGILTDTDLTLRSASRAPAMAVMERALIRLAMLGRR
ncbi:DNA polymerase III subunit delta [Defluviimonas sp. WL0024]|uniref:DNA-directed DNA polymerase n=1 Tax=Albidovulum salinarum TaxID=2984153 RepID=A0ABT2X6G1_9RHOB|nr:DNA polymerase III subunit delta [Defluviimonas sp. WL0024]MCU9849503.1 DNA polymerase III subunit delta [Defluviimonas sp. WL0024]